MKILTVTTPFGDYQRGAQIVDPAQVAAVCDSDHAAHVVASDVPDAPRAFPPPLKSAD